MAEQGPSSPPTPIDPARLSQALAARLGDARVIEVKDESIGTGQMSESRRLHLVYDKACGLPETMIVKYPSEDPRSRSASRATRCYEIETHFYRDVRSLVDVGAPECFVVEYDADSDDFLLLLEDLAPCRQGDQILGCTADEISLCVEQLVGLHGPLWDSPRLAAFPWLDRSTPAERATRQDLVAKLFPAFVARYGDRLNPETLHLGEAFVGDPGDYFTRTPAHRSVVHGDFRLDNLLFLEREEVSVAVVDFQTVACAGPGLDLSYLIGASLALDMRRSIESDLVAKWVDGLRRYGVELSHEEAYTEYRRYSFAGLVMSIVASMIVKQTERGDEMFLAMANRHASHALDVEALAVVRD